MNIIILFETFVHLNIIFYY